MKEKFRIAVESIHCDNDAGHVKNVSAEEVMADSLSLLGTECGP
jgi:hypothetical protein